MSQDNLTTLTPENLMTPCTWQTTCTENKPIKPLDCKAILNEIEFIRHVVPKERFVEYEPSDIEWLKYFGIAKKRFSFDTVVLMDSSAYLVDSRQMTLKYGVSYP